MTEFGIAPGSESGSAEESAILGDWYSNIIVVERRKVILWTNEKTLFSFVMLKGRAKKPEIYKEAFLHGLKTALVQEGMPAQVVEKVLLNYSKPLTFRATKNKSVVASMNQIGQDFGHMVWYEHGWNHTDVSECVHKLNNTPW